MKLLALLLIGLGLVALSGCDNKGKVDTSKLEKAFASSGPVMKENAGKVATAVKAGNWTQAAAALKELASDAKLTAEQREAIKDVAVQIQEQVKQAVAQGAAEAQKAAEELKKSISGK